MELATLLGSVGFFLIFISAIYWCFDVRLGFRAGLILVLSEGLNSFFKLIFHGPRPYWISSDIRALSSSSSFGLPSGHAEDSVCVWGLLARSNRRHSIQTAILILILIIGISRMYLGVHYPFDVAFGWAIGSGILVAFLFLEPAASRWIGRMSFYGQIILSSMASASLLILYFIGLRSIGIWQIPEAWSKTALIATGLAISPLSPEYALESAGMLFGMATGYSMLLRKGGFYPKGPFNKRLARYSLGMVGLIPIWFGIGLFCPSLNGLICMGLLYLRSFLAGLWVAGFAPLLFIKLNLARKSK